MLFRVIRVNLFVFFLIIMGLSNLAFANQPPLSLTISTWNIEWLSSENKKAPVKRTPEDIEALHQIVNGLNADIIALQEINDIAAAQAVFGERYEIILSDRSTKKYADLQFKEINQYTGFAIKKGIPISDPTDVIFPHSKSKLRFGAYITLYPNTAHEVHVLSIHFKAGCTGAFRNKRSCRILKDQGRSLSDWMISKEKKQQQYVVLGDFNHNLSYNGDWLWKDITRPIQAKPNLMTKKTLSNCLIRSNKKSDKTHKFRYVIDHIITSPTIRSQNATQQLYDKAAVLAFKLSDHCPVQGGITLQ
ncbi:endonuclease/exonuclease/phosphatase family protein [Vibrio sp.]|nr:endonuclease/exonuclease/phosphatase family protein [Vibrio sp.]